MTKTVSLSATAGEGIAPAIILQKMQSSDDEVCDILNPFVCFRRDLLAACHSFPTFVCLS
jgi:hypothetical protein